MKETSLLVKSIEQTGNQPKGSIIQYLNDEYIVENKGKSQEKSVRKFVNKIKNSGSNGPRAVFVAVPDAENVYIGFAVRNPKDKNVDKHLALEIAESRGRNWFNRNNVNIHSQVIRDIGLDEFTKFLNKCKNWKSFKDKKFPKWIENI